MKFYSTDVPKVVSRQFDNEIVIANYENGLYYSLLDSAADVWLALRAGFAVEDIVSTLAAKYPASGADISSTVAVFVDQMLAEGIILRAASGYRQEPWSPMSLPGFVPPVIERFDDLRDLLLVD